MPSHRHPANMAHPILCRSLNSPGFNGGGPMVTRKRPVAKPKAAGGPKSSSAQRSAAARKSAARLALVKTPPKTAASTFADNLVGAGQPPSVGTVIYVHGIGNKPEASILKCQWDRALFDAEMGDRTRLAYWVDRE